MPDFSGKKILITGASQGLGAAAAFELSKLGAQLALVSRTEDKLESVRTGLANPESHRSFPLDLQRIELIAEGVEEIGRFLGQIDVVLHTAGGGFGKRSELIEHADFDLLVRSNLSSAMEINRLVVPQMRTRKLGNLVHTGSIASSEAVGSVGYNTVKAALAAYVRSLGRELAKDNIVVTGILPGGFSGPNNAMVRLQESKPEVYKRFIEDRLPRNKMGTVEEILPLLLLLCSEGASMMGGCMVPIDAGEGHTYTAE